MSFPHNPHVLLRNIMPCSINKFLHDFSSNRIVDSSCCDSIPFILACSCWCFVFMSFVYIADNMYILDKNRICTYFYRSVQKRNSSHFKNPMTDACTNEIEATQNALKISIKPCYRTKCDISDHLLEFIWRRKNMGELWIAFIRASRDIHYDLTK